MNKTVLLTAIIALVAVSCKKDRNCNCKVMYREITASQTNETSSDYTKVMKDVSYLTALKACVHSKEEYKTDPTTTISIDTHCSLD